MISDSRRQFLIFVFMIFAILIVLLMKIFIGGMGWIEWGIFVTFALGGSLITYYFARKVKIEKDKYDLAHQKPVKKDEEKKEEKKKDKGEESDKDKEEKDKE